MKPILTLMLVAVVAGGFAGSARAQLCNGEPNAYAWPADDPVWTFSWLPAAHSSGVNGSGLEIRDVAYRGRTVLKRGHAPILNVEYDAGGCGCFRDWSDQEVIFEANGVVNSCFAASLPGTVQTVCDVGGGGGDIGDFAGVSVEEFADKMVMTTQYQAGWYRYTMRWHFYLDGRLQPEFGFATVPASCVANTHNHHVYWRMDFDIDGADGDRVMETSDAAPDLTFDTETARTWGDPMDNVAWTVMDDATGLGYRVTPGTQDLLLPADVFSQTDAFIARYRPTEIDDNTFQCQIRLNSFLNNEAVGGEDVVFWYRGGYRHLANDLDACDRVGPMLTPVGDWGQDDAAALSVQLTPQGVLDIPPEGGSFEADLVITNTTSTAQTADAWFNITNMATGLDLVRGPLFLSIDADGAVNRLVRQNIPAVAPAGDYVYTASVGTFPDPIASDSFAFTKAAAAARSAAGPADWDTYDLTRDEPLTGGELWETDRVAVRQGPSAPLPALFALDQNYPNPFNPETSIRYALQAERHVTLRIYNTLGQVVRTLVDGVEGAGFRSATWDARDDAGQPVPSGTYFYQLTAGDFEASRIMVLLK